MWHSGQYVGTCDKSDNQLSSSATKSACDSGGSAYMCSDQSPWAVNETLAYGWAAVNIAGQTETTWCCACYELTFTSAPLQGKTLIVQASNTGGDLGTNQFDLAVSNRIIPPYLYLTPTVNPLIIIAYHYIHFWFIYLWNMH
jgi:hypothetical protein